MGKYIVIAIAMSAKNNRIAEHGEVVDDSELNTNASELISGGFIRVATEEELEDLIQKTDLEDDFDGSGDDDDAEYEARKLVLLGLGFVLVETEEFTGVSFPESGVNFSNLEIKYSTKEEFDAFVAKVEELEKPKVDFAKDDASGSDTKTEQTAKDKVTAALKK